MRILYLIDNLRPGGAQKALLAMARAVKESGGEAEVWRLGGTSSIEENFKAAGIPVRGGASGLFGTIAEPFALLRHVRRWKPDIIQTFLFHSDVAGRIIGRLGRRKGRPKIIGSVRATNIRNAWWQFFLLRRTARMSDAFTAVSQRTLDFAVENEGLRPGRASVIPNGIELAEWMVDRAAARARLGIPADAFVISCTSRLHEQKGYDYLLPAAREVLNEVPNALFLIAGYGPLEAHLKSRAAELYLGNHVRFLGYRTDIPDILAACDIFCLPSLWEGMSNSVLEAMAAGRAVIATAVDGNVEQVVNGETGILVPPADSAALREAILTLARDPNKAQEMGRKSRERVEKEFSLPAMTKAYLGLYERLLQ